jgi:hypothetical protein
MLEMANAASPEFESVTVCVAEFVPTFCFAKVNDAGAAVAIGAAPLPVTGTLSGAPLVLVTEMVPVTAAVVVGVNRTLTMHEAFRTNAVVAVHVVPVATVVNATLLPLTNEGTALRFSVRSPTLVTVRDSVELVPTLTFPNASGDGVANAVGATG